MGLIKLSLNAYIFYNLLNFIESFDDGVLKKFHVPDENFGLKKDGMNQADGIIFFTKLLNDKAERRSWPLA